MRRRSAFGYAGAMDGTGTAGNRFPAQGWVGLLLVGIFWPLNWCLPGSRTLWGFFPLWLGYALTMDGLTLAASGSSLLRRGARSYLGLFLCSAPIWWVFEAINGRTRNWIYLGVEDISRVEYAAFATLSFSTVLPAVFGTAEWASTLPWIRRLRNGPGIGASKGLLWAAAFAGAGAFVAVMAVPDLFFPFVWISLALILDPLNRALGRPSLLGDLSRGDWRRIVSLSVGCLMCGFFWELWNVLSYPKWVYRVPHVDFCRIFEMPVLGYGGYIPFAFELFALYHLLTSWLPRESAFRAHVLPSSAAEKDREEA